MKKIRMNYNILTENLDSQIIKEITNVFNQKEIWLLLKDISKNDIKKIKVKKIFLVDNLFFIKLKSRQFYNIIEQILNLNLSFQICALKNESNIITKEKFNEKLYIISLYSSGKLNIDFFSNKFDEKMIKSNMDIIIKRINMRENKRKKIQDKLFILFIINIIVFFIAGDIISMISYNTECMWMMWLWLPIPILSIILGFKYRKMKIKCQKNIISGFIIAFLLLLFGAFTFIFPTEDYQKILKIENIINIDLPNEGIYTITKWNDESLKCNILHEVYFEDKGYLEKELKKSNTWILKDNITSNLETFISPLLVCKENEKCYYSIYFEELKEYNIIPDKKETYHIYAMMYNQENNSLKISEYDYEYR